MSCRSALHVTLIQLHVNDEIYLENNILLKKKSRIYVPTGVFPAQCDQFD